MQFSSREMKQPHTRSMFPDWSAAPLYEKLSSVRQMNGIRRRKLAPLNITHRKRSHIGGESGREIEAAKTHPGTWKPNNHWLAVSNIRIVREHAMFHQPRLHDHWNGKPDGRECGDFVHVAPFPSTVPLEMSTLPCVTLYKLKWNMCYMVKARRDVKNNMKNSTESRYP